MNTLQQIAGAVGTAVVISVIATGVERYRIGKAILFIDDKKYKTIVLRIKML